MPDTRFGYCGGQFTLCYQGVARSLQVVIGERRADARTGGQNSPVGCVYRIGRFIARTHYYGESVTYSFSSEENAARAFQTLEAEHKAWEQSVYAQGRR